MLWIWCTKASWPLGNIKAYKIAGSGWRLFNKAMVSCFFLTTLWKCAFNWFDPGTRDIDILQPCGKINGKFHQKDKKNKTLSTLLLWPKMKNSQKVFQVSVCECMPLCCHASLLISVHLTEARQRERKREREVDFNMKLAERERGRQTEWELRELV